MKQVKDGLGFQLRVTAIDLGNRSIPISKFGDFQFKYYTDSTVVIAYRIGSTYSNCVLEGEVIVVTINQALLTTGVVKCRMEININDSVLPSQPFLFRCPEQKTDIEII